MPHFRVGPKTWWLRAVAWPVAHLSMLFGHAREARSSKVTGRLRHRIVFDHLCFLTVNIVFTEYFCCNSHSWKLLAEIDLVSCLRKLTEMTETVDFISCCRCVKVLGCFLFIKVFNLIDYPTIDINH